MSLLTEPPSAYKNSTVIVMAFFVCKGPHGEWQGITERSDVIPPADEFTHKGGL